MIVAAECRLCSWKGAGWIDIEVHLKAAHGLADPIGNDLEIHLHGARDRPDRYENTFGLYNPRGRMIGLIVKVAERAADDPMRWGDDEG